MALSKLYLKLDEDIKSAMRRKDEFVLKVLRFLKSNIDSVAKDKLKELSEEEVVAVLRKRIKQSEDAKEKYAQGG
ncbi:MAG TPA: GatB/YqeY domain-containing protein, partial [Patescibacteria group bacterium]|nr:GatB/YqeY domain-containing protein [Patescibacteria group bacterium]